MRASDAIMLRGLRVAGRHGVLPEEHQRAQPFEVDLDLELDLRAAGASDALGNTADYGAVAAAVAAVVGGEHCDLMEHLAERIAAAAVVAAVPTGNLGATGAMAGSGAGASGRAAVVDAVTVTVRKLRPPVPEDLAHAAVRIRRTPAELGLEAADPLGGVGGVGEAGDIDVVDG